MNVFGEGPASGRKRAMQRESTARAVLEAARQEFERVGFDAANVRAIAARAGVSAGTVLHHYGDKRELLHAALFADLEEALDGVLRAPGDGPLAARLARLGDALFGYYARRAALSKALLREALFASEPWASRFRAQTARAHGAIAAWAQQAIDAGELRADVNPALIALAYLSYFYFALLAWVQGGAPEPAALLGPLVAQLLDGARAVGPAHDAGVR